jgi:hypothetical protein
MSLIYFQQRCIKRLCSIELERGLVVHLDVGIHVADVAVVDQVQHGQVTYNFLGTEDASHHVSSRVTFFKYILKIESELIFTIVISISSKLVSDCLYLARLRR